MRSFGDQFQPFCTGTGANNLKRFTEEAAFHRLQDTRLVINKDNGIVLQAGTRANRIVVLAQWGASRDGRSCFGPENSRVVVRLEKIRHILYDAGFAVY